MFNDNSDFFPTPPALIEKMINILPKRWKGEIKYVLEPSAGSGNLVEGMQNKYIEGYEVSGFWIKAKKKCDIIFDCVESDEGLINILRGKGFNVVHNDFLTYSPNRYYDLIWANFPFSDCEKHLNKAIAIQERMGGKIVAITSASMLENTYSKERKLLKDKLDSLNASIEFIDDAFIDSERSTSVRVALIYIDIPMKKQESMFEKEFRRDNHDISFDDSNAIAINRNKLEQLVFEYQLVIDTTVKLFEEKARIDKLLDGFGLKNKISITGASTRADEITVNEFIETTNQDFWNKFIEETRFETKLPSALLDNFRANMQKQRNISFNMENLKYFYQELTNAIPRSYEETIGALFDKCTKDYNYSQSEFNKNIWGYSGWKTNNAFAIKGKIIIPCHLSSSYYSYNVPSELMDLNIVFNNLTGIDSGDELRYNGDIMNRMKDCEKKIETTHFIVSTYKKHTCHIEFKDKKALAKFNYLGAKGRNWIDSSWGKKRYEDMNDEEKEIVVGMGFEPCEFNQMQLANTDYLRLM